jgi:hypothetical protein
MKRTGGILVVCAIIGSLAAAVCPAQEEGGFGFDDSSAQTASTTVKPEGEVRYTTRSYPDENASWEVESVPEVRLGANLSSGAITGRFQLRVDPDRLENSPERILYEAWAAASSGPLEIKAGLMKLPWGRMDSLRVLDVLNPQDYGEPPTRDVAERSIPQAMVRLRIAVSEATSIQAVWEPFWEGNRIPFGERWEPVFSRDLRAQLEDSVYYGTDPTVNSGRGNGLYYTLWSQVFAAAYASTLNQATAAAAADAQALVLSATARSQAEDRVDSVITAPFTSDLSMSQAGLRLETGFPGVDIGLQYWYGFNRLPTVDQAALSAALATGTGSVFEYDRLHHMGADFATVLWDTGLRGEVAVNLTKDLDGDDPEVRNGTFEWAAGADRKVLGITVNLQARQVYLLGADRRASSADADDALEDVTTTLSLSLKESFIRDTLEVELVGVWGVEEGGGLLMPCTSLAVNDDLRFRVLGRYFFGPSDGNYGEYKDSSGVELSVGYMF